MLDSMSDKIEKFKKEVERLQDSPKNKDKQPSQHKDKISDMKDYVKSLENK